MHNTLKKQIKRDFEADYSLTLKHNKSFSEHITELFEEKGVTKETFEELTGLNVKHYRSLTQTDTMPSMSTVVSVCIGLDLDIGMSETLLDSLFVRFNRTNKKHCAYQYLIQNCRGMSIEECNEILESLGLTGKDLLGSKQKL